MARSQLVERVMPADSFKATGFFHRVRAQTLANVVHATGGHDRTPRRTHIFFILVSVAHLTALLTFQTHMRVAQG